jgi:hypothetical protein
VIQKMSDESDDDVTFKCHVQGCDKLYLRIDGLKRHYDH